MRLAKDHSAGAYAVYVWCRGCHTQQRLADVVSNLDGEAFVDYYCSSCVPPVKGPCNRDGCTKPECQK